MELHFFGNGSAFTPSHTNAWFRCGNDLFLVDLSMYNVEKAEKLVTEDIGRIFILLTHMHSDHASGIGLFAQWCHFRKNRVPFFAADAGIKRDILQDMRATGVERSFFRILAIDGGKVYFDRNDHYAAGEKNRIRDIVQSHVLKTIPTRHAPELDGKCFGFKLKTAKKTIVYTGDSGTLEPFLPELDDAEELYTEIAYSFGVIHLLWAEQKDRLIEISKNTDVYLMHMDDVQAIRNAVKGTDLKIVH